MALQCRTCGALERALAGRTAGGQMSGQELLQELWKPNAKFNRGGRIRTGDLLVPNQTRYRTALRPAVVPQQLNTSPGKLCMVLCTVYACRSRSSAGWLTTAYSVASSGCW